MKIEQSGRLDLCLGAGHRRPRCGPVGGGGTLKAASWPLALVLSGCMEAQAWNRLGGALHLTPAGIWCWGHHVGMFWAVQKNVCK